MVDRSPKQNLSTHRVENPAEGFEGRSLYRSDPRLVSWLRGSSAASHEDAVASFGDRLGRPETWELARQANAHRPELHLFDRNGRRLDEVRFHPAYHQLMALACEAGIPSLAWRSEPGGHQAHAALEYMLCQVEPGVCCPITMSYAGAPVIAREPGLAEFYRRLIEPAYDGSSRPWSEKPALTMGMAMTEKQGGSDLRTVTTRAVPDGDHFRLDGHKWFCSAPMSDAFLVLGQAPGGLTCFFLPRWRQDGSRNGLEFQRLKDKMGNHSNASSELELREAEAIRVGDEGRGVATIIEMVHHTRLDCAVAAAGLMRQAVVRALHHARQRRAFGKRLIDHDLMARVLADLDIEAEASMRLAMRAAALCDHGPAPLARLGVAVAKYWINKRCPLVVAEAMEALGGVGYVEESVMPRLFRESPLNGIWEGSGNVICLDILRTFRREPELGPLLRHELGPAVDPLIDAMAKAEPGEARLLAGRLARLWQAQLLRIRAGEAVERQFKTARQATGAFGESFPSGAARVRLKASLPEAEA